ncbi:Diacetyl reductase [(S)-acetoin forming] [Fonsecaea pedrosoi]|nr:Diacetyl reductase [(S)-acetoin forming] [Fonsecaea pedrosoi]
MGLAVVEHLVREGWNVTVVDFNEEAGKAVQQRLGGQVLFVRANVISYESVGQAFVKSWQKWGRLDFGMLALIPPLGFGDRIDFCAPADETASGFPAQPDKLVLEVCLDGVVWTAYLALHFFRKNPSKSGVLVSTSSLAGLYPAAPVPLYGAAKHGVIGLTRSLAKRLKEMNEPISVNCICPGLVPTPLVSQKVVEVVPKELLTPYTTITRAVQGFISDPSITGQAAECSGEDVIYRPVLPYGNYASDYIVEARFAGRVNLEEMMEDSVAKGKALDGMKLSKL